MAASRISAFLNSARKGFIAATITVAALAFPLEASAKTYLVNGILSATAIGYGFKNLKAKIPNASLFLMVTGLEPAASASPSSRISASATPQIPPNSSRSPAFPRVPTW